MQDRSRPWAASGRVFLFFIACAVLLTSIAPIERQLPGLPAGLFIGLVTSVGTLILTILFVRWDGLALRDVGAAIGRQSPLRFAIGFLLGLLLVGLHTSIVAISGDVRWVRIESVRIASVAAPLVTYVLLSCREELAFHGYPLRRLNSFFGLAAAQLIVAVVFALEHVAGGSTLMQAFLGAGVGSLLFGMASIATRGLALPIGLHAAWNLGDWMRGGKGSGGLWRPIGVEHADRAEMIGYLAVMLSATLAFWWFNRTVAKTSPASVSS